MARSENTDPPTSSASPRPWSAAPYKSPQVASKPPNQLQTKAAAAEASKPAAAPAELRLRPAGHRAEGPWRQPEEPVLRQTEASPRGFPVSPVCPQA